MEPYLFPKVLLSDDLSPVPNADGFAGTNVTDINSNARVSLLEYSRMRRVGNQRRVESGEEWKTTKGAVARAYAREYDRLLDYILCLTDSVEIDVSRQPHIKRAGVSFSSLRFSDELDASRLSSRTLQSLVRDAIESTGKNPNPRGPRILAVDYWLEEISKHFRLVLDREQGATLVVENAFLPVFAEWRRLVRGPEDKQRRVIRAEFGLPDEIGAFRDSAKALGERVHEALDSLAGLHDRTGWQFISSASETIQQIQKHFRQRTGGARLALMFSELPDRSGFSTPVAAFEAPPRRGGFSIELEDGRQTTVPSPPWQMASSIKPNNE